VELTKKDIFIRILRITIIGTLLIGVIFVMLAKTFGWFTQNTTNNINSLDMDSFKFKITEAFSVSIKGQQITPDEFGVCALSDLEPGDDIIFSVSLHSDEVKNVLVNLHFLQPDNADNGYDIPYFTGGLFYYISSQLKITNIKVNGIDQTQAIGYNKFLLAPSDIVYQDGLPLACGTASLQNVPAVGISDNVLLTPGADLSIQVTLTFVNSGVAQNAFKSFGTHSGEKCSRRLYCGYSYESLE